MEKQDSNIIKIYPELSEFEIEWDGQKKNCNNCIYSGECCGTKTNNNNTIAMCNKCRCQSLYDVIDNTREKGRVKQELCTNCDDTITEDYCKSLGNLENNLKPEIIDCTSSMMVTGSGNVIEDVNLRSECNINGESSVALIGVNDDNNNDDDPPGGISNKLILYIIIFYMNRNSKYLLALILLISLILFKSSKEHYEIPNVEELEREIKLKAKNSKNVVVYSDTSNINNVSTSITNVSSNVDDNNIISTTSNTLSKENNTTSSKTNIENKELEDVKLYSEESEENKGSNNPSGGLTENIIILFIIYFFIRKYLE